MALDLSNRKTPRIHRHDLIVETRKPPLILGDQLRIEASFPVAWNLNLQLCRIGQDPFLRIANTVIAAVPVAFLSLLRQMVVHPGTQHALGKRLLHYGPTHKIPDSPACCVKYNELLQLK